MKCVICNERSGKRYCPGTRGYICSQCCGTEREVTIACPFECSYLQDAYKYELLNAEPPGEPVYPNHDVTHDFLHEKEAFVGGMAVQFLKYGLNEPGAIDSDLRTVLDALVKTYETLGSGLIYESLPTGQSRVNLYREVQKFVQEWRDAETERMGMSTLRDSDVLKALVFLSRVAQAHDNRRAKGRSFIAFLRKSFPTAVEAEQPRLIVPGA